MEIRSTRVNSFTKAQDLSLTKNIESSKTYQSRASIRSILMPTGSRKYQIFSSRIGVDTGKFKKLEDVGNAFGVTRERVRQIEVEVRRKLRHYQQQGYL